MQYDVFISCSLEDSDAVNALIDRLRRDIPGITICYDIENIESSNDYRRKLADIMDNTETVIFVCSDSSLESVICEKEVIYAKNIGKRIIPYMLPGAKLKGWFLFEFGNVESVDSLKEEEIVQMIEDIRQSIASKEKVLDGSVRNEEPETLENQLEFDSSTGEFKLKNNHDTLSRSDNKDKPGSSDGIINGHDYVDLGLPSGLKWATCNIGALMPEEYGDYFAWGEVQPKEKYSVSNSRSYQKDNEWLKENGYLDDKGKLTLSHDAAHQNWGASWRLPTKEEIKELIEHTTSEWITRRRVKGCLVKSKNNDKNIFFPAAGGRDYLNNNCVGELGGFWSSYPEDYERAYLLIAFSGNLSLMDSTRYFGCSVRPVSD